MQKRNQQQPYESELQTSFFSSIFYSCLSMDHFINMKSLSKNHNIYHSSRTGKMATENVQHMFTYLCILFDMSFYFDIKPHFVHFLRLKIHLFSHFRFSFYSSIFLFAATDNDDSGQCRRRRHMVKWNKLNAHISRKGTRLYLILSSGQCMWNMSDTASIEWPGADLHLNQIDSASRWHAIASLFHFILLKLNSVITVLIFICNCLVSSSDTNIMRVNHRNKAKISINKLTTQKFITDRCSADSRCVSNITYNASSLVR